MVMTGPHDPIPVEPTWDEFVPTAGGLVVKAALPRSPDFENADYFFTDARVVAELKELETELSRTDAFFKKFVDLHRRVVAEDPSWKPVLFGGSGAYPTWFWPAYRRIFRPPLARILKKANRQLRETKSQYGIDEPCGIVLFVNDGFTGIGPAYVVALAADILQNSYSSIDCFVYLTVNRYVEVPGSDLAHLVWIPVYSDRAPVSLVDFVNTLGRQWFDFIERKIGPFDERTENAEEPGGLKDWKSITRWRR